MKYFNRFILLPAVFLFTGISTLTAQGIWAPATPYVPALRDELTLNGTWDFTPKSGAKSTIPVPEYWDANPGFNTDQGTYERSVSVPSGWTGKRIKLDFEGVSQVAEVFVNGASVGTHIGGWIPFSFDITSKVTAGSSFALKVVVKGGNQSPIIDGNGKPLWPVGWHAHESRWGIVHPVWLRAYGNVYIEDAFIKTSFKNKQVTITYTLRNTGASGVSATVRGDVTEKTNTTSIAGATSSSVSIAAGSTATVNISIPWTNPHLWMPDDPYLYHLRSAVTVSSSVTDNEVRRFGFREILIEGTKYKLNGVVVNMVGENITFHAQGYNWMRYNHMWPSNWAKTLDSLKKLNIRLIRFHQQPAPNWIVDLCDEKGMLVIAESAVYAREYTTGSDKPAYLANSKTWIGPWIKSQRNHPSIIIWNAENENGVGWIYWMSSAEMKSLGDHIMTFDNTRPVNYDGDQDVGGQITNFHYPEGYIALPTGSIYSWTNLVSATKPTGCGEFITHYDNTGYNNKDHILWQCIWSRGMRCIGFSDIRPYTLEWAWTLTTYPKEKELLRNTYNPVALFDKAYDDLGITPFNGTAPGCYPTVTAGANISRTLILYNDDFRNEIVEAEMIVKCEGTQYATGKISYSLALGTHMDITSSFQVPFKGGKVLEIILRTNKNGVKKFQESKFFQISGSAAGTTSSTVTFSPASNVNSVPGIPATPTGTTSLCLNPANSSYTTSGANGAASYIWYISPSGAGTISGTSTTATVDWNNTYTGTASITVKGQNNTGQSASSSALTVSINPLPLASAGKDVVIVSGNKTTLTGTGGVSYLWSPSTGLSNAAVSNPQASPAATTTYSVTVTDSKGCKATDVMKISVVKATAAEDNTVTASAYPNPFNEKFIVASDVSMNRIEIFNINGILIISKTMNGEKQIEFNTENLASGVYYIRVTYEENSIKMISVVKN